MHNWRDSAPLEVEIVGVRGGPWLSPLTAAQRAAIKRAVARGERRKAIAARYGVSVWTVWKVGNGNAR